MKYSRLASLGLAGVFLCSGVLARADTDADRIKRLEEQVKTLLDQVQKLTDQHIAKLNDVAAQKEKDVMTV